MTASPSSTASAGVRALRGNSLGAVVMLLTQYCLGISVNLYATLPASDHGKSLPAGFAAAIGKGPVVLSLHALLGMLLLFAAAAAFVRSVRLGARVPRALTLIALVAIIVAWLNGSEFVGHLTNGSSLAMALATAVALLCYVLVIWSLNAPRSPAQD